VKLLVQGTNNEWLVRSRACPSHSTAHLDYQLMKSM